MRAGFDRATRGFLQIYGIACANRRSYRETAGSLATRASIGGAAM